MKPVPMVMQELPNQPNSLVNFFDRLPQGVIDTLTTEQIKAIQQAFEEPGWRRSPVEVSPRPTSITESSCWKSRLARLYA